jgi:16S rRNA (guanine527-N7)-methyltransferase
VENLGIADRVIVLRGRGEEVKAVWGTFDVVTARAVAPLGKLLGWTIPLLHEGGRLVTLKGQSAQDEIQSAAAEIKQFHLRDVRVVQLGSPWVEPATTVVTAHLVAAQ